MLALKLHEALCLFYQLSDHLLSDILLLWLKFLSLANMSNSVDLHRDLSVKKTSRLLFANEIALRLLMQTWVLLTDNSLKLEKYSAVIN